MEAIVPGLEKYFTLQEGAMAVSERANLLVIGWIIGFCSAVAVFGVCAPLPEPAKPPKILESSNAQATEPDPNESAEARTKRHCLPGQWAPIPSELRDDQLAILNVREAAGYARIDLMKVSPPERRQRTMYGGLPVLETATLRVCVSNDIDGLPKVVCSEVKANGKWIAHGLTIGWWPNGDRDETYMVNGEAHGDKWYFDTEGRVTSRVLMHHGAEISRRPTP
jgi:hypothetical protein